MRARPIAFKDISEYISEQDVQVKDENGDVWVVTPHRIYNKETKKMNAELGVNKVNYYGNTNNKRRWASNKKQN